MRFLLFLLFVVVKLSIDITWTEKKFQLFLKVWTETF